MKLNKNINSITVKWRVVEHGLVISNVFINSNHNKRSIKI